MIPPSAPTACVLWLDGEGAVLSWSEHAERVFGRSSEDVVGYSITTLLPFIASGANEGWCERGDGSRFRALLARLPATCETMREGARDHALRALVVTDVTRHRAASDATDGSVLERQVLEASEQLQRQIGQDLHDGLGQLLTGTAFLAKSLEQSVGPERQAQAQRVVDLLNQAIGRVRILARGLSPIHVEAQSFEAVLRHVVGESSELLGVSCRLDLRHASDTTNPATIAQLCLIVREAITNAVRHGKALHINVGLSRVQEQRVLTIEDDGIGIGEVERPLEGLGLRSMRYRAKMIGGWLEVTRKAAGTVVRCGWSE